MATRAELRVFQDRREAGRVLADAVRSRRVENPVVFGLPRGGVPVAFEVARALDAPLEVLVARKIGAPGNPELAIGAIAEGGARVLDHAMIRRLFVSHEELEHAIARATTELEERAGRYRGTVPPVSLENRTAVVVDDGLATGSTARAAIRAIRARSPKRVVLAVPVGARESVEALRSEADEVVCAMVPEHLLAIGFWYRDFGQTSDHEVVQLLARARGDASAVEAVPAPSDPEVLRPAAIELPGGETLAGDLVVPAGATGLVIFAHGSGSSRHSPRNRHVAATAEPQRPRDAPARPAHTRGGARSPQRLRHPAARPSAARRDRVGEGAARARLAADRLLRSEHRRRRGALGGRRRRRPDPRRRLPRRPSRPRRATPGQGGGERPADRRQPRSGRGRSQPAGAGADARTRTARVMPGATHLFEEPGALDEVARLASRLVRARTSAGVDDRPRCGPTCRRCARRARRAGRLRARVGDRAARRGARARTGAARGAAGAAGRARDRGGRRLRPPGRSPPTTRTAIWRTSRSTRSSCSWPRPRGTGS